MRRLVELKVGVAAGIVLALAIFLLGPGCGGQDQEVRARNLTTGEIQTFPSEEDVPPDWVVCPDPTCTIPPSVPCQNLSEKVCTLNPNCRLKVLWCSGTTTVCPDGQTCDEPPPPTEECEYTCIPKLPLLCEELTDEQQCKARSDCEWGQWVCPAICQDDGKGGCLPCPSTCYTKQPPICQDLDEQQCKARPDCEWDTLACTMECIDDGKGGCLPCDPKGVCQPTTPPPPPCPEIAAPPPGFCTGGKIVPKIDPVTGCTVGFTCEMPGQTCFDLNKAYIDALQEAKGCNAMVATPYIQCSKLVETELLCGGCSTYVNPSNTAALQKMADAKQKFFAQSCDQQEIACPANACMMPKSASCLPTPGSLGSCVDDMP